MSILILSSALSFIIDISRLPTFGSSIVLKNYYHFREVDFILGSMSHIFPKYSWVRVTPKAQISLAWLQQEPYNIYGAVYILLSSFISNCPLIL